MDFEKTPLAAHPRRNIYRLVLFLTPLRSRWTVPLKCLDQDQEIVQRIRILPCLLNLIL
jgi:hypothetical protein